MQEVLEKSLSKILKTPVAIIGCGRTDAQVHASQFFFHVDIEQSWDYDLLFRLNRILPADITVYDIIVVDNKAHARFDAVLRRYDYYIHSKKDPFLNGLSAQYPTKDLNFDKMKQAVGLLLKYTDYSSFCKTPDKNLHNLCNVHTAILFTDKHADKLRFQITANRFLGKMIRIIVGKLLKVGTGELSVEEFELLFTDVKTSHQLLPAHPQGLYLSKITYPYIDIEPSSYFSSMINYGENAEWQII